MANLGKVAVAVMLLVVAVVLLAGRGQKPAVQVARQVYYFDLNTRQLITGATSDMPIDAPSGGTDTAVRAHVFTCGACTDDQWRIGYLTSYTEAALQRLRNPASSEEDPNDLIGTTNTNSGALIALPPKEGADVQWMPVDSGAGRSLLRAMTAMCNGAAGKPCLPPSQ